MRLLAVLILSFFSLSSFAACPSGSTEVSIQNSDTAAAYFANLLSYNSPAQYTTNFINAQTVCTDNKNPCTTGTREQFSVCRLPSPVQCDSAAYETTSGKYGVNYSCQPKCSDGYNKNAQGSCVDKNGCTEDKFLKAGQCSDRCSEYGSNASGYNMQTHDCNFNQHCGAMQKRQRYDLSSPTGLGSGACVDDPNGCPSGYSWLPSTNGGSNACRSTTSNDVNSTCPAGTKIVGDGSTGQCQSDGNQNQTTSSSTSTSSSGSPSASSGSGSSTSSSGATGSSSGNTSSGGDSGGGGSSQGPQGGTSASSSSGTASTGGTVGTSGGGPSSGSSSGGQTGGYSGRCDIPPQCQNSSSIECAQLYQTWFAGCPLKGYTHQEFVPKVDDGKAKVRELFDGFKTRVSKAPAIEGFSNFLKFNRTGSCPTWPIDIGFYQGTFDYLCSPIIPWDIISGVLMVCSLLIAFRLAAK